MRKATLYKIGLMIVEYQYDFFMGKSIKPMKLKDLADDLEETLRLFHVLSQTNTSHAFVVLLL